jgi:hypothetical protein
VERMHFSGTENINIRRRDDEPLEIYLVWTSKRKSGTARDHEGP